MTRLALPLGSLLLFSPACDPSVDGDSSGTEASSTSGGSTSADPTGTDDATTSPPNPTGGPGTTTTSPGTSGSTTAVGSESGGDTTTGGSDTTSSGPPTVVMETSMGTLMIELFPEQSPITVDNFLAYIADGFYDGTDGAGATIFHRVIPGFVIQGGGLTEALAGKATMPPIVNEFETSGLTNDRGTLSMARTSDPDSATSQFFINLVDNGGLDTLPGYAVFAQVTEGMDIVDAIAEVPTGTVGQFADVPTEAIIITSVSLE